MAIAADLFEPKHYSDVRLPLLEAKTLPTWCYTSQEFYQREVERLFMRMWNFIGREDEIPNPGDYLTTDICGESVVVIRDQENRIQAFANTCRHRGTRLLSGSGHCRAIICPYHAWTYALDGKLVGTPGMEKTEHFDPADNGLIPIRLETWAGFIFVNFSSKSCSLMEHLGDLPQQFASYNFSDVVCVRRTEYDLACNWKIYIENAMEDYHTPTVHRTSIGRQVTTRVETEGQWDAIHMESERSIAVLPEDNSSLPHISGLTGKPATGTFFTVIYPATFFATTQDCMWWLQALPRGPESCTIAVGSCFPKDTVARPDFEHEVKKYYTRWDKSLPEDNAISERQQAGLHSKFSQPGRLSWHEPIVHAIANWVLDHTLEQG
ncbi:MAG: aromatic ring-hydroxylating dioxygenase subunit alpha [Gammaproteobacteria bacterium]|nr:aromatic ring-hydroxylating dioxygenase subunit alpha [Gammaproteobacteria bacterium]